MVAQQHDVHLPPPTGYQMGDINTITEKLALASLSGPQRRFLEIVQRKSFGMAFFQRSKGVAHPGTACRYDRTKWASDYGWDGSQMKRVRDQLIVLGILWFTPTSTGRYQNEGEIGFNLKFEEWLPLQSVYHQAQRQKHCRRGAGYSKVARQLSTDAGIGTTPDPALFCVNEDGPPDQNGTDHQIAPSPVSTINGSVPMSDETAPMLASLSLLENSILGDFSKEETAASAAGALCATTAVPPHSTSLKEKPLRTTKPRETTNIVTPHPLVAPPPRSSLPKRRVNEQLHAYWIRALADVQGQAKQEQLVVQACAQTIFAWSLSEKGTLNPEDCQLLGRLHHAAGSWGTVMHWVFACNREPRCDIRGWLQACIRRQKGNVGQTEFQRGDKKKGSRSIIDLFPITASATPEHDEYETEILPPSPMEQLAHQLQRQMCTPGTVQGRDFVGGLGITNLDESQTFFCRIADCIVAKNIPVLTAQTLVRESCDIALSVRSPLSLAQRRDMVLQLLNERLVTYAACVPVTDDVEHLQRQFSPTTAAGQSIYRQLALQEHDASAFFKDVAACMVKQGVLVSNYVQRLQNALTLAQAFVGQENAAALRGEVLRQLGDMR